MLNKVKMQFIKKSLNTTESKIFDALCFSSDNIIQENKEKAINYAKTEAVKKHHIGAIFSNDALRKVLLTSEELEALNEGMAIIDELYKYQLIIKNRGYSILCSPDSMKSFLTSCSTIREVKKIIPMIKKELLVVKEELEKKSNCISRPLNLNEILIDDLDEIQKENLSMLGFKIESTDTLSLSNLKKMYNQKLYSTNYTVNGLSPSDSIKELSSAFFNVKKAFNAPS